MKFRQDKPLTMDYQVRNLNKLHVKCHLRRGLQISEGNDFFVDKKLNGLLLPVVHVAVQLVSVHS